MKWYGRGDRALGRVSEVQRCRLLHGDAGSAGGFIAWEGGALG